MFELSLAYDGLSNFIFQALGTLGNVLHAYILPRQFYIFRYDHFTFIFRN